MLQNLLCIIIIQVRVHIHKTICGMTTPYHIRIKNYATTPYHIRSFPVNDPYHIMGMTIIPLTHPLIDRTGQLSAMTTRSETTPSLSSRSSPPTVDPMCPNAQTAAFTS